MKVNTAQPITFMGNIRVKIKNKSLNPIGKQPSIMSQIMRIAFDNKSPMIINEDVLILSSSNKLQKDLLDAGIKYEVEDYEGTKNGCRC